MNPVLVALLGVMIVPLFVATWRTSLLGLAWQGLLMALVAYQLEPRPRTPGPIIVLLDLGVLRGLVVPVVFYAVLRGRNAPTRDDLIAPNLLSWTVALGMVLSSFSFAEHFVAEQGEQRTLLAVAACGVMLGFLVLSSQAGPFSQMTGVLRLENAIALFELGGRRHEQPLGVHLGLLGVFVITVGLFRWYLAKLGSDPPVGSPAGSGGPSTL
jgi:hydrogenase-4 component E